MKLVLCVPLAERGAHDVLAIVLMLVRHRAAVIHILEVTARVLDLRDEKLEARCDSTIRGHFARCRVNKQRRFLGSEKYVLSETGANRLYQASPS